jgi:hypothetical protein
MGGPKVPTTQVICSRCGREMAGTPYGHGFHVRRHRDSLVGLWCDGVDRTDHQPVVVHADEAKRR